VPRGTAASGHIKYRYPYISLFPRAGHPAYASRVEESRAVEHTEGPGIRDAEEILLRAQEDESAALEARVRYRADGLPILVVDGPVAEGLRPGENVVDVRPSTIVNRHLRDDGFEQLAGRLYLTNQRLMLLGRAPLEVELGEIDELGLAGEQLLIRLRDGSGLSIEAARPRLLRVQIAAALVAGRS
jgi:hypothetical protein